MSQRSYSGNYSGSYGRGSFLVRNWICTSRSCGVRPTADTAAIAVRQITGIRPSYGGGSRAPSYGGGDAPLAMVEAVMPRAVVEGTMAVVVVTRAVEVGTRAEAEGTPAEAVIAKRKMAATS